MDELIEAIQKSNMEENYKKTIIQNLNSIHRMLHASIDDEIIITSHFHNKIYFKCIGVTYENKKI